MPEDAVPEHAVPDPNPVFDLDTPVDEAIDVFAEVLDAGSVLDELDDAARVEAWASSALGVWAEAPDAADHDEAFCTWLAEVADGGDARARQARLVRAAVMSLLSASTGSDVAEPADTTAAGDLASIDEPPAWIGHLGTAVPTRAWRVERHGVESVGIGFSSSDGSEHSLLADVVDGEMTALIVAPGPDELFDGSEDLVAPEPLEVAPAAERIVAAWRQLHSRGTETPESLHVNGALARTRLAAISGGRLDDLRAPASHEVPDPTSGPLGEVDHDDADDRAETDRWACSVLDGAIGSAPGSLAPASVAMADVVLDALIPERIERQPALEREAYGALEWADWLGVVIESVRWGAGTHLDPEAMVDAVNRCPEVTSSIPRSDRSYYAWAFSLVLALWRRAGVVDAEGKLTADGVVALPAALRRAWGPVSLA
jgi:hypothetical protein